MHKTNMVDYAVVYDGKLWLELDDGNTLHLERGDVCRMALVTHGAIRDQDP